MVYPKEDRSQSAMSTTDASFSMDPLDASVGPAAPDESTEPGLFSMDSSEGGFDGTVTPSPFDGPTGINASFLITALVERHIRTTYPDLSDQEHELLLEELARETGKLNLAPDINRTTRAELAPVRNQYLKAIDDNTREVVKKLLHARGIGYEPPTSPVRQQLRGAAPSQRYGINRNQSDSSLVWAGMKRNTSYGFLNAPVPEDAVKSEMTSNYYVLGEIGKGGFGTVYRAQHKLDRAEYAIKKIPLPPPGKSEQARYEALLTEIRSMARLEHGNIVRYYNSWIGVENFGTPTERTSTARRSAARIPSGFPGLSEIPESEGNVDGGSFIQFGDSTVDENPKESPTAGFIFEEFDESPAGSFQQATFESAISETFDSSSGYSISIAGSASPPKNALVRHNSQYADPKNQTSSGPVHCLNIVMSLYPVTLKDYLVGSKEYSHCYCPRSCAEMFHGLVLGIEYLHSSGLIHRDIKPGNVFLTPGPSTGCCGQSSHCMTPKIGDFGLVTAISPVNIHGTSSMGISTTGSSSRRVGTSWYIPPEGGEHCGVDVWALGIVLCEMLYNFNTMQERAAVLTQLTKTGTIPEDIWDVFKDVPEAAEIVKGCVERKPALRWTIPHLKVKVQSWLAKLRRGDEAKEEGRTGLEVQFDGLDVAAV